MGASPDTEDTSITARSNPSESSPVGISVKIRYTADCRYTDGLNFSVSQDDGPLNLQVTPEPIPEPPAETSLPVLEIITQLDVASKNSARLSERHNRNLEGKRILKIGRSRIVIRSSGLLQMIREVVEYYPSQNLTGETVTVREPYAVLVHHIIQLQDLLSTLKEDLPEKMDDKSTKREHLQILLDFLQPHIQRYIAPAQRRLEKKGPTVTFEDVWYLLRPGLLSYCLWDDTWLGCVIASVQHMEADDRDPERWAVSVWFHGEDSRKGIIKSYAVTIDVDLFEGERAVTALPIFPREFFDQNDKGERRESFEKRGKKTLDVRLKGHSYMNYDGHFMDKGKSTYKGQVIICCYDLGADYPKYDRTWLLENAVPKLGDQSDPGGAVRSKVFRPLIVDLKKLSHEQFTDDHLFLFCPVMYAFALATKTWELVNVDYAHELEAEDSLPEAHIAQKKLKIINALSDYQINSKSTWSADFIKNKGEGIVVLLHGPPGVGKTYTVETTALRLKRPLICLTLADIGTKEETVEKQLTRWFSMAQKWQAILLIDECDIFLERREHRDIARNGVVSAFLRKMEYFGGMLFLTTNRVGLIDDAFMSRVHVIIEFDKLDSKSRNAIWKSLMDKLSREKKGKIRITNGARKYILENEEMQEWKWNGREIRNAFQTAIALAEYDACQSPDYSEGEEILVESEQFRVVLEVNKSFRQYLESMRNEDEAERAHAYNWRNDLFKSSLGNEDEAQREHNRL